MPNTKYGWQSKRYPFGLYQADVASDVQSGLPTKLLCTASYYKHPQDNLKIVAKLGGSSELVLFDSATSVNRLEQELSLGSFSNVLPANEANWYVSFRVEIDTPFKDPTPESVDWPFIANQDVILYLYKDLLSQSVVLRKEATDTELSRAGVPVTSQTGRYLPLTNVQTVFYFSEQSVRLRAATAVTDRQGRIRTSLPSGLYDIEFYGGGVLQSEYVKGYAIGAGNNLTPWKGGSVSGVSQAAEYNAIKSQFSTLYWPGYMIAEDFSPERALYRNEAAETNTYGNDYAYQMFGRVFAGLTYVDFIGIAIDPSPE